MVTGYGRFFVSTHHGKEYPAGAQEHQMKSVIYWFSGTGNSLVVARKLAHYLGDASLVPVAHSRGDEGAEVDCVGIVFPVYAFGLPNIVHRFLGTLKVPDSCYVFTVATMGSVPGGAHHQARSALRYNGVELASGWSVRMPMNYTPLGNPPGVDRQAELFAEAERQIGEIGQAVKAGKKGYFADSSLPVRLLTSPIQAFSRKRTGHKDHGFAVLEQCSFCGTCVAVCPVENITLDEGKPVWQHHCEQCLACLQWCPVEAIQLGSMTAGRRRYHHPEVTVDDLILRREDPSDDAEDTLSADLSAENDTQ